MYNLSVQSIYPKPGQNQCTKQFAQLRTSNHLVHLPMYGLPNLPFAAPSRPTHAHAHQTHNHRDSKGHKKAIA